MMLTGRKCQGEPGRFFPGRDCNGNHCGQRQYSGGQIAMKIVKQAEFDYFMGLVLPHAVTFDINVTYATASGSVTTDATFSGRWYQRRRMMVR
jgi:hypothetical protein